MPTLNLTNRGINAIKPTTTRVEYFDATVPGLALRVTPTGAKSWTILYRHRAGCDGRPCSDERLARFAAAAMKQDQLRGGWTEDAAGERGGA